MSILTFLKTIVFSIYISLSLNSYVGNNKNAEQSSKELMAPECDGEIIKHKYFSLCYDEIHEQAFWVKYTIKPKMLKTKKISRSNNFRSDNMVTTKSASTNDYKKSGFDRGHLCPAADMSFDTLALSETFFMSNISPQYPGFNRGTWKQTEENVRTWAAKYDSLLVITGPIFNTTHTKTIGKNKVGIPDYFYKVILAYSGKNKFSAAFLMPHSENLKTAKDYIVSLDSLEKFTKLDFFRSLPDNIETTIEKKAYNFYN